MSLITLSSDQGIPQEFENAFGSSIRIPANSEICVRNYNGTLVSGLQDQLGADATLAIQEDYNDTFAVVECIRLDADGKVSEFSDGHCVKIKPGTYVVKGSLSDVTPSPNMHLRTAIRRALWNSRNLANCFIDFDNQLVNEQFCFKRFSGYHLWASMRPQMTIEENNPSYLQATTPITIDEWFIPNAKENKIEMTADYRADTTEDLVRVVIDYLPNSIAKLTVWQGSSTQTPGTQNQPYFGGVCQVTWEPIAPGSTEIETWRAFVVKRPAWIGKMSKWTKNQAVNVTDGTTQNPIISPEPVDWEYNPTSSQDLNPQLPIGANVNRVDCHYFTVKGTSTKVLNTVFGFVPRRWCSKFEEGGTIASQITANDWLSAENNACDLKGHFNSPIKASPQYGFAFDQRGRIYQVVSRYNGQANQIETQYNDTGKTISTNIGNVQHHFCFMFVEDGDKLYLQLYYGSPGSYPAGTPTNPMQTGFEFVAATLINTSSEVTEFTSPLYNDDYYFCCARAGEAAGPNPDCGFAIVYKDTILPPASVNTASGTQIVPQEDANNYLVLFSDGKSVDRDLLLNRFKPRPYTKGLVNLAVSLGQACESLFPQSMNAPQLSWYQSQPSVAGDAGYYGVAKVVLGYPWEQDPPQSNPIWQNTALVRNFYITCPSFSGIRGHLGNSISGSTAPLIGYCVLQGDTGEQDGQFAKHVPEEVWIDLHNSTEIFIKSLKIKLVTDLNRPYDQLDKFNCTIQFRQKRK